ncbi:hypothetical protein HD806DRAFT_519010 [Xylariaceae sp. AK1471]|nr:hypothetical protein HD806DRAFT_519010 [Xylariaceae sp. AK1471]
MPISRKKSCEQCRLAKARCSLESVCSRCVNRGLSCKYAGGSSSRISPYTRQHLVEPEQNSTTSLSPAITTAPTLSSLFGLPDSEVFYSDFGDVVDETPALDNIERPNWDSYQINVPQGVPWGQASWDRSGEPTHSQLPGDRSDLGVPNYSTFGRLSTSMSPWCFLATSSLGNSQTKIGSTATVTAAAGQVEEDLANTLRLPQPEFPLSQGEESEQPTEIADGSMVAIYGRRYKHFLALRWAPTTEKSLMTRVLSGQIESYPRMLIRGSRLPPFIYPQCVLNNRLSHQCTAMNGSHQCLPEPLANCAVLTQMFYNRSSSNAQFVWKMIYDEQKRLYEQSHSFDDSMLLATIQALTIYLLIQAQDTESMAKNDVASLVVALSETASTFHFRTKYRNDIYQNPNLSQKAWAIHECEQRTKNLFYIIGTVLVSLIGDPDRPDCGTVQASHLPCGRDLWDPDATESWAVRLHKYKSRLVSDRVLIIDDLLDHLGGGKPGKNDSADALVQKDLVAWCENADELGTLVWMASLLNRRSS